MESLLGPTGTKHHMYDLASLTRAAPRTLGPGPATLIT
jgi:hypothetical protein